MDRALNIDTGEIVTAADIQAGRASRDANYVCPDQCCAGKDIPVHFQKESNSIEGGRKKRKARFATNPGFADQHDLQCNMVSRVEPDVSNTLNTINQAIAHPDGYFLFRINCVNHKGTKTQTSPAMAEALGIKDPKALKKWKKGADGHKPTYVSIAISDVQKFHDKVKQIRTKMPVEKQQKAESRMVVDHGKTVQMVQDFVLNDFHEGIKQTFEDVVRNPVDKQKNAQGRTYHLGRVKLAFSDVAQWEWGVNMAGNTLARYKGSGIEDGIQPILIFEDAANDEFNRAIKAAIQRGDEFSFIAEPFVGMGKADRKVGFRIKTPAQIAFAGAPLPETKPRSRLTQTTKVETVAAATAAAETTASPAENGPRHIPSAQEQIDRLRRRFGGDSRGQKGPAGIRPLNQGPGSQGELDLGL